MMVVPVNVISELTCETEAGIVRPPWLIRLVSASVSPFLLHIHTFNLFLVARMVVFTIVCF